VAAATILDTPLPAPTVLDAPQASASRWAAQETKRDTAAAAATQRDAPTGHAEIPELPLALAGRYRVVRLLARGGEGFVLLAEGPGGEGLRVIKLYVPNAGSSGPKGAVLDNISAADKAHVVHIHEHGKEGVWYYEVQEYVANGSLRDLMTGPQPLADVASMLRELSDALRCLHGAKLIHRDIKPENILVRTRAPLDLVLTDFGIASVSAATLHETTRSRTALYSSPEAMTGIVSEKSDWWSIGMILVELITGRHPLAGIGSQNRLDFWIAQNPIDTEGVSDPRWRALCRGLLVRDAANRWGSDEVGRWLAGETVAVADDSRSAAAPVTPSEATVSYRPYTISGTACATPRALAAALLQFWDEGVKHLSRGLILKWVQDEVKDYDLSSYLMDLAEGDLSPDARLAALVYRIDPALPPVWKGRDASYSAILAWANDAQTDSSGREVLFQLATSGLRVYPHADLQSLSLRFSPAVARIEELWTRAARFLTKTTNRELIAPEMASLLPRLILALEHPPALDQLRIFVKQWANDGLALRFQRSC
jgi:serine/threonine protein kinase